MDRFVEAKVVDSHHLRLTMPTDILPGSKVMVAIQPVEGIAEEQEWYLLSSQVFAEAYGEDEPDYSLDRIKTSNK